jgi:hypothetical protein
MRRNIARFAATRQSDRVFDRDARKGKAADVTIGMKPQPDPSTQEVLAGLVERVTYHNGENGFCVLRIKARGHRELVTVIGCRGDLCWRLDDRNGPMDQ